MRLRSISSTVLITLDLPDDPQPKGFGVSQIPEQSMLLLTVYTKFRTPSLVGDVVLKQVAEILERNVRVTDSVVRWGGEEFMIVLENCHHEIAGDLAERIRKSVESEAFKDVGKVTLSLGVTAYRLGESRSDFIARADAALYTAKNNGRNLVHVN